MKISKSKQIKRIADLRTVSSPPEIALNFIKYNLLPLSGKPFLPKAMCIYVTYRCNMRCRMCGIWKQSLKDRLTVELSREELDKILSDPLFSKLEYININGGEPNLREDLPELAELFIQKFKHLRTITINSNGLLTERAVSQAERISRLARENDIKVWLSGAGGDDIFTGYRRHYALMLEKYWSWLPV